ncbi:MAG: hypothetical protein ACP6IY_08870 [Promethearchaeia archaeon]
MSRFIDFDRNKKIFYDNLYFDDFKIVIKIPICNLKNGNKCKDLLIKKFDPAKYIYIFTYEKEKNNY